MTTIINKFNLSDGTHIRYRTLGKGKPLFLFHTFRNRLEYSENVAELLNSDYHKPVNLGNPDEYKILDIAKKIKEITSSSSNFVFSPIPGDDPEWRKPDISVAREILGWEPKINLDVGLLNAIDWYKKNK